MLGEEIKNLKNINIENNKKYIDVIKYMVYKKGRVYFEKCYFYRADLRVCVIFVNQTKISLQKIFVYLKTYAIITNL